MKCLNILTLKRQNVKTTGVHELFKLMKIKEKGEIKLYIEIFFHQKQYRTINQQAEFASGKDIFFRHDQSLIDVM